MTQQHCYKLIDNLVPVPLYEQSEQTQYTLFHEWITDSSNVKNKYGLLTWRINEAYVKGGRTSVLLQKSRFLWISINRKNRVIMLFINVVSNFPITDRYLTCIKISSDYCNLKFKKIYLRFISCTINCGENKSTGILFCDVIFSIFLKQSIISKDRQLRI